MSRRKILLLRLMLLFFTVTMSAVGVPGICVSAYGIFGEITTEVQSEESKTQNESNFINELEIIRYQGENVFNIWFAIMVVIMVMQFTFYQFRLPRKETIVTKKVRMND